MRYALLLLLASCVTKGRYEVSQVQLGATRAALNSREADARRTLEDARLREEALDLRLTELQSLLKVQQDHTSELEAELQHLSQSIAEHTLRDQVECPALEPNEETQPDDDPVKLRRIHIAESLEQVAEALKIRAENQLDITGRAHQHAAVVVAFQSLIDDDFVVVEPTANGTTVRVLVAKLYNENRITLSPLGVSLLERIAKSLADLTGHELLVVGHTDDIATHSATLPSNWELGFAYAAGVVRELEVHHVGLPIAAASYAGQHPLHPPLDDEARRLNRRIELELRPRIIVPPTVPEEESPPSE